MEVLRHQVLTALTVTLWLRCHRRSHAMESRTPSGATGRFRPGVSHLTTLFPLIQGEPMHDMHASARTHVRGRRAAALVGVLGLGLGLALSGCGSDNSSAGSLTATSSGTGSSMDHGSMSADTGHNDADVTFATEMIPHHEQALAMVTMTEGRDLDPAVQTLADNIKAAQTPEIQTMTGWLTSWGAAVPSASPSDDMSGMGGMSDMPSMSASAGSMSSMPGMMSDADMTKLKNASDAEFQKMWLQMMIKHHEGAVQMAQTEQTEGQYQPAIDLAGQIIASQSKEIDTMKKLLGGS